MEHNGRCAPSPVIAWCCRNLQPLKSLLLDPYSQRLHFVRLNHTRVEGVSCTWE